MQPPISAKMTTPVPLQLAMPDAEVLLYPGFFPTQEADAFFAALQTGIAWERKSIRLYGKEIEMPRLTAWYGDPSATYTYSGLTETPRPWTPALLTIRERVDAAAGVAFNSVLLNYYCGERDSMSWHSDDEPELGRNPVIASISFGAARRFQFKHCTAPALRAAVGLTHGSLLLMRGPTQHHWKHQLPKSTRPLAPRINLTFRIIYPRTPINISKTLETRPGAESRPRGSVLRYDDPFGPGAPPEDWEAHQ